jgi:hypothetical protein
MGRPQEERDPRSSKFGGTAGCYGLVGTVCGGLTFLVFLVRARRPFLTGARAVGSRPQEAELLLLISRQIGKTRTLSQNGRFQATRG